MLESRFQAELIDHLKKVYPKVIVLKNDPNYMQGFPDLTILWGSSYAVLEVKKDAHAPFQPNQEHYLERMGHWTFSAVIFPENRDEILHALDEFFEEARS